MTVMASRRRDVRNGRDAHMAVSVLMASNQLGAYQKPSSDFRLSGSTVTAEPGPILAMSREWMGSKQPMGEGP